MFLGLTQFQAIGLGKQCDALCCALPLRKSWTQVGWHGGLLEARRATSMPEDTFDAVDLALWGQLQPKVLIGSSDVLADVRRHDLAFYSRVGGQLTLGF